MGLSRDEMRKVPKGMRLAEYYQRIYDWHKMNAQRIFDKLSGRPRDDPYIQCYFELVRAMPHPNHATLGDIAFICHEVIAGLMEWAYHERDEYGVKIAAYAHYILDTFFDGFGGEKTKQTMKTSRLHPDYKMSKCMDRLRQSKS